jgi:hypothetical protein
MRHVLTVDSVGVNADDEQVATVVSDAGHSFVIPVELLPEGVGEGDVLAVSLEIDSDEAAARRKRVTDLQKRLFG